jgi:VanZ family protein
LWCWPWSSRFDHGGFSAIVQRAELMSADAPAPEVSSSTSTLPLALVYAALVVYASLYPFGPWRDQGISPFDFLSAPLPYYWTGFDVFSNAVGYAPLAALAVLALLRTARVRRGALAVVLITLALSALSLLLEALQTYLLDRRASNVDWALNTLGALGGAAAAWALERMGLLKRWSRLRAQWVLPDARGALVLVALWPFALLFPAAVPLGLGQVVERLELWLAQWLTDTPWLEWLPLREVELQPLLPLAELVSVACGLAVPCLLGYSVIRHAWQRLAFGLLMGATALAVSALSAALSYGPEFAWEWLVLPVRAGLVAGAVLALGMVFASRAACLALALVGLTLSLTLLNQAPEGPYFAQTLQTWEQGRFIRFHGVAQWLGWLWPFAALLYVAARLSRLGFEK